MINFKEPFKGFYGRAILSMVTAFALAAMQGCTAYLGDGSVSARSTYRVAANFRTGAFDRFYNIHIPAGFQEQRPVPLVVVVHGAFDTAEGMARYSGFSDLADKEGFIVLYPEGIGLLGYLQHWNAGHCCGKAAQDDIDDVGFVSFAIEATRERFVVSRVFMVGFSNGGMFVHRFAAEKSHVLDGAAVLAGSIGSRVGDDQSPWQIPLPENPVTMLLIHGSADKDVPAAGGLSDRGGEPRVYQSLAASADFWRNANECSDESIIKTDRNGAVTETLWEVCKSGNSVATYVLAGWDHVWPGPFFTAELDNAHPLKDYDAASVIWSFFKTRL